MENASDVSFIGGSSQALYPTLGHPLAEYGMHFAGDSNIYVSDVTVVNNWGNPKIQVNGANNNISIFDSEGVQLWNWRGIICLSRSAWSIAIHFSIPDVSCALCD